MFQVAFTRLEDFAAEVRRVGAPGAKVVVEEDGQVVAWAVDQRYLRASQVFLVCRPPREAGDAAQVGARLEELGVRICQGRAQHPPRRLVSG